MPLDYCAKYICIKNNLDQNVYPDKIQFLVLDSENVNLMMKLEKAACSEGIFYSKNSQRFQPRTVKENNHLFLYKKLM